LANIVEVIVMNGDAIRVLRMRFSAATLSPQAMSQRP
jgi:hypothetical protein